MDNGPGVSRIENGHDVCPAPESTRRQTAADNFAKAGQVRHHTRQFLHAAGAQPQGDDLVENQQDLETVGQLAQSGKISMLRRNNTAGTEYGFHDDSGNPVGVCFEKRGDRRQIVKGDHLHVLQHTGRNSGMDGSPGGTIGFDVR